MSRNYLDQRILWSIRHALYKPFAGSLAGVGYLGAPSFVKGFSRFFAGSGLGIFPGWRIEITAGRVDFGNDIRIGNNLLLNCGSQVTLEDKVTISANVFIGTTDVDISNDLDESFGNWRQIERPVFIGRGSFIGFGAVILPGTNLGQGCVIGANAVVRGEILSGSVVAPGKSQVVRVRG